MTSESSDSEDTVMDSSRSTTPTKSVIEGGGLDSAEGQSHPKGSILPQGSPPPESPTDKDDSIYHTPLPEDSSVQEESIDPSTLENTPLTQTGSSLGYDSVESDCDSLTEEGNSKDPSPEDSEAYLCHTERALDPFAVSYDRFWKGWQPTESWQRITSFRKITRRHSTPYNELPPLEQHKFVETNPPSPEPPCQIKSQMNIPNDFTFDWAEVILKYLVVEDREKKRKEAIQQEKETHLERRGLKYPQNLPINPNPKPRC